MKRLGQVLGSVLAIMLTAYSLQALAAGTVAGRSFDHSTTGFQLTGVHALTACETCHAAGVFKGTPRACDGCHALGKRVVATPKSSNHIVTDAPCDTCHFNASTFLGARFNHGTALPGQCRNCHNGRQSIGKPASHNTGLKATDSCDHCHRSFTWFQASWNHVGVVPHSCDNAGCHRQGDNQYYRSTSTHALAKMRTGFCDDCHTYVSWTPHHMPQTGTCSSCHNDVDAKGTGAFPGHMTVPAGADCQSCHAVTTTASTSWAGGVYNHAAAGVVLGAHTCSTGSGCHGSGSGNRFTASSHAYTPKNYSIMMTTPGCDSCHMSFNTWTPPTHITPASTNCNSCHDDAQAKGPASYSGHPAVAGTCTDCHSTTTTASTTWAGATGAVPANHVPNTAPNCTSCHPTPTTVLTGTSTHPFYSTACNDCHYRGGFTPYTSQHRIQQSSHKGNKNCSSSSCHKPLGRKGVAYVKWD